MSRVPGADAGDREAPAHNTRQAFDQVLRENGDLNDLVQALAEQYPARFAALLDALVDAAAVPADTALRERIRDVIRSFESSAEFWRVHPEAARSNPGTRSEVWGTAAATLESALADGQPHPLPAAPGSPE